MFPSVLMVHSDMLPSLDNFITFGKDVFAQRPDYRAMAIDIYTTAMNSDHLGDNDRTNGAKVAESLLLNLPGHLDEVYTLPFCNFKS